MKKFDAAFLLAIIPFCFLLTGFAATINVLKPINLPPKLIGPTNLTATLVNNNRIHLTWEDNSSNETGFTIERKVQIKGFYIQIAVVGGNIRVYDDTAIVPENKYDYRVRAYADDGNRKIYSGYSNEAGPSISLHPAQLTAPFTINTDKLTITGKTVVPASPAPFTPITVTTDKLTITGGGKVVPTPLVPFTPVNITTEKLTITGKTAN